MYNPNLDLFGVNRIIFEFPVSGGILPTYDIQVLQPFKYANYLIYYLLISINSYFFPSGYVILTFEILVLLYVGNEFIVTQFLAFQQTRKLSGSWTNYFKESFIYYELTIAILFIVIFALRIAVQVATNEINLNVTNEQFANFQPIADLLATCTQITGITVFICWLRILRYLRILPRL